jgi:hypothetical protein
MRLDRAHARPIIVLAAASLFLNALAPKAFSATDANDAAAPTAADTTAALQAADSAASVSPPASSSSGDSAEPKKSNPAVSVSASQPATIQVATPKGKNRKERDAAAKADAAAKLLRGTVTEDGKKTPFLNGVVQSIPKDTPVNITFTANLNSEISQKGDEVMVEISRDVKGGSGVGVPGGWFMHGLVTDASEQKRGGRDGFVTIEFDKLVSPDRQYEVPFHTSFSTKDNKLKSVAKVLTIDSGIVGYGALGGAILSVQMTGLPTAIATHGISVGGGAVVGGTIGLVGALKRKGHVASIYPGDCMKLITAEAISLPGFDKTQLPSGQKHEALKDMTIKINKTEFSRDPMGDKRANLLWIDLTMKNSTPKEYAFFDLAVVSDMNKRYTPSIYGDMKQWQKRVKPDCEQEGIVTFSVDDKKRKYWLVLLDRVHQNELTRVPLN